MRVPIKKLIRNARGATTIEYGLFAGMMALVLIAGFSGKPQILYGRIISAINDSH